MARRASGQGTDGRLAPSPLRVALLLNFINRRCRQELQGIHRYAWPARQWIMRVRLPDTPGLVDALEWKPDGIIAEVSYPRMVQSLQDSGVPVVNVSSHLASQPFVRVESDNVAIGRMAADHFLSKGFRNYGYLDAGTFHGSQLRRDGFIQRLQESGCDASVLSLGQFEGAFRHWAKGAAKLAKWLQSLPKPAAVLAYDDHYASLLSQACITAGVAVPEQVALLGVENDDVFWRQANPPLSSIQTAAAQVGFDAAEALDRLMAGQAVKSPIRLAPMHVEERASTDILAIDDSDVAMAVRYINTNATRPIGSADVIAAVPLGRRVLERRFRRALNRSIQDELHRVRIDRVKQMLANSHRPLPRIAEAMGFYDAPHLSRVFRKITGMSPAAYRRKAAR